MAEETTATPEPTSEEKKPASTSKKSVLDRFLDASGYKVSDIIASNEAARIFVTANGGKYRLAKNGEVVHLQGPETPAVVKAASEE